MTTNPDIGTPWAIVDRAIHWTDKQFQVAETVVRNAVRLLEDASLLQTYERYGTAFTIATIAFEEAGKVALQHWGDDERVGKLGRSWTFHMRKQAAAGCLLLAEVAKDTVAQHPARRNKGIYNPGTPDGEADLREVLANAIARSQPARLLELIALHAVERTKHVGFYADEWAIDNGISGAGFSAKGCAEAVDEARQAVRHLRSADHLHLAKAVYLTGPLREEYVQAGKAFGQNMNRNDPGVR